EWRVRLRAATPSASIAHPLLVRDGDALRERSMNGASSRDLREPLVLFVGQVAAEEELQLDAVDLSFPRIPQKTRLDAIERPPLAFGVQPNREDRSGPEGGQHCF